ncbi:MAG: 2-C-methyl-D-erythritol 2,4-cyclodiphosphate synthase [Bacteroidetes bacterium]|nr:2-C-methyl-D-erythritol 2,4-cyclodiphosphate synthase [Bacteroidota bacterium]
MDLSSLRTGIGYDVHRLVPDRNLIIGGVKIDFHLGLLGHSDADVLLHAIIDSLLGASNLGDIGKLFSDNDPKWKDISSLLLLSHVGRMLIEKKVQIINIDAVVICDRPKLLPYVPQMKLHIASSLDIPVDRISIKGKTSEKLGFVGAEEGIESYSTCLIAFLP